MDVFGDEVGFVLYRVYHHEKLFGEILSADSRNVPVDQILNLTDSLESHNRG